MKVDIDNMIQSHMEKIEDLLTKSSDIIRIIDFIIKEMSKLELEAKKMVDDISEKVFFFYTITGKIETIKQFQEQYLESVKEKLMELNQDFSPYLDYLNKKRMINSFEKISLLDFAKLIMDVTFTNTYSLNLLKRIEEYQGKIYRK